MTFMLLLQDKIKFTSYSIGLTLDDTYQIDSFPSRSQNNFWIRTFDPEMEGKSYRHYQLCLLVPSKPAMQRR